MVATRKERAVAKARWGQTKPRAPYLYTGVRPTGESGKEATKSPHLMPLHNRSLESRMHTHASVARPLTVRCIAHYHVVPLPS
jgi:hypothetical protein